MAEEEARAIVRDRLTDRFTANQIKHLIAGGVAGAVSRTSVSPLERMKILYQVLASWCVWSQHSDRVH